MTASCCPPSAWGELKNSSYVPKGEIDKAGDLRVYRVGQSHKCIIWNYDVFGFDGGRTKQMADFLADHGYMVIIPDYFDGGMIDPTSAPKEELIDFVEKQFQWDGKLKEDWEEKIRPYALKHGAKTFGAIGTCVGSYLVLKLSFYVEMKAGISMHPSHSTMALMLGLEEEDFYKDVKCPQMFMPANEDHENTKIGGLAKKVLTDGLEVIEFPAMNHGWSIRGDLSMKEVERDVKKTFNFVLSFFGKYLH